MRCRERGVALLTVIFLLALLLVVALVLSDKVLYATRRTGEAGRRDQALQAAAGGVEWALQRLAERYRQQADWDSFLAEAPAEGRYPARPTLSVTLELISVDIFIRDNADGDGDPRHDLDARLFLLARVPGAEGGEVVVESLCGVAADTGYLQAGGDATRSGQTPASGPATLEPLPLTAVPSGN